MSCPVKTVDRHSSLDSFLTFICLIVEQRKTVGIKTSEPSVLFEQPLSNFVDSQFFRYRKPFGMLIIWGLQSEQDILQEGFLIFPGNYFNRNSSLKKCAAK